MDDSERLRLLYEWAVDLDRSENILRHHWGLHLLSDWKSLSLLVQDDSDEPRATDRLMDGTRAR